MSHTPDQPEYENFDLFVAKQGDAYTIRAEYSQGGEGNVPDRAFPLDASEFLDQVDDLAALVGDLDQAKAAGALMRQHLFPDAIWTAFQLSRQHADLRFGRGLRLRLRIQPLELSWLPWEYCYDADEMVFLAQDPDTPLVRYTEMGRIPKTVLADPPARVLLFAASPQGWQALDVEAEVNRVREELEALKGSVALELRVIEHGNWDRLHDALVDKDKPHVLHFIGHGEFDSDSEQGRLVLEQPSGEPEPVLAEDLAKLLHSSDVKVVVLNACKTARRSRKRAFMGVAPRLAQTGVPAVIAMQFAIPDQTANRFAHKLYHYLALGEPLDRAVTRTRIDLSRDGDVFWAIPVLFMRAPDGVIWRAEGIRPDIKVEREPPQQAQELNMAAIDQSELRRRMTGAFKLEELEVLCADVNSRLERAGSDVRVSLDIVGSGGREITILNLIGYLDRRGLLNHLLDAVREARPGLI